MLCVLRFTGVKFSAGMDSCINIQLAIARIIFSAPSAAATTTKTTNTAETTIKANVNT